jgi:hypothetical protein
MKLRIFSPQHGNAGLLDLFVMLIAVGAVVLVGYAYMHRPSRRMASRINCVNNIKQIGLSFRLWANDNNGKMPAQVPTRLGGTEEFISSGNVFPHFAVMSNELGTPKIIVCPDDKNRTSATNFGSLGATNVSYFMVIEADEAIPEMWLSGDRNLATTGLPIKPGLFWLPTNRVTSWTSQIHSNKGSISLADGSVQQYTSAMLQQSATNALRAYRASATNATFRLVIP